MRGFWGNRNWPCGSGDEGEGVLAVEIGRIGGMMVLAVEIGRIGSGGEMGLAV